MQLGVYAGELLPAWLAARADIGLTNNNDGSIYAHII